MVGRRWIDEGPAVARPERDWLTALRTPDAVPPRLTGKLLARKDRRWQSRPIRGSPG